MFSRGPSVILAAIPIIFFFLFVYIFSVDGPLFEEHDILRALIAFEASHSLVEAGQALLLEATDHKPVTTYVIAFLHFYLFGHVDFVHIAYIASVVSVALPLLYALCFRRASEFYFILITALLLGCHFIPIGNIYWGGAGLAGNLAMLFAFLALYGLSRQSWPATFMATLSAIAAIFSLGNGLLVLPAAVMLWIFAGKESVARNRTVLIKHLCFFLVVCISSLALFWSVNSPTLSLSLAATSTNALDFLESAIRLLGAGYAYDSELMQFVMGICVLLFLLGLLLVGYHRRHPVLAAYMAFLVATVLVLCLYRNWTLMDIHFNRTRYYFVSMHIVLILILCYLDMLLPHFHNYKNIVCCSCLMLLCSSFAYSYIRNVDDAANFCVNKKIMGRDYLIALNDKPESDLSDNDKTIRVSIERGYFDPQRLVTEEKWPWLSGKLGCSTIIP